jgi:2-oxoglutarate decarboxylase
MAKKQENDESVLESAAKKIGETVGKVAAVAGVTAEKPSTPEAEKPSMPKAEKPSTPKADKPSTPKTEKPGKLQKKNKSRLPRKEKKARQKAAARQAA